MRCLDGLAEIALAVGDASRCRAHADELLAIAEANGRVRLQLDTQAALARLCAAQGQPDAAQRHGERVREIAQSIEASLLSSGLAARLRLPGAWH